MPLDSAEGINDALAAVGIGEAIIAFVKSLPPPPAVHKFADFGPILDIVKGKVLPLIDQVIEDVND